MKKSFSPSKSKVAQELQARQLQEERRLPISKAADYRKYFCHYNNAVYMGGMSSYKKHGKGLLLHDDGSAVITDYLHDTPSGHTVIFRQNSIASVLYKNNVQFQVAYKQGKYIISIPFNDSSYKAHGEGILIDYGNFKIYKILFKRGQLVQKILHLDRRDNQDVFNRNINNKVIAAKHEQAFNLTFQTPHRVQIKQNGSKLNIGYFDQNNQIHGLSFTFYKQNLHTNGKKSLYLKFIEKGYYRHSNLETFGQKLFSNGNKYIGEFDKGQFHGLGILICPSQMKWVFGKFNQGQLQEIIQSNYRKFTQNQFEVWAQTLRSIHQRYKQRWIDMDIELPSQSYLYNTLKLAVQAKISYIDPDQAQMLRDNEERMSRIQKQFQNQYPGSLNHSKFQKELDRHYDNKSYLKSKLFIPSHIEVEEGYQTRIGDFTPINKFQQLISPKISQNNFREEDPFKIELIKVQFDNEKEEQNQRIQRKSSRSVEQQTVLKNQKQKYKSYSRPQDYAYGNSLRLRDTIYNQANLGQLRKQKQRVNHIQSDQLLYNHLRRGLQSSPVHRNYYSISPKYEDSYPQRYIGKLTNKRIFKYQQNMNQNYTQKYPTTAKYYPPINTSSSLHEFNKTSSRSKIPKKSELDQLYNSKYNSPKEIDESRRNFIKNNYQYWNGNT